MADYAYNTLTINKGDIKKLVDEEGNVDFNILLPMPEDLNVTSSSENDPDMYIYFSKKLEKTPKEVAAEMDRIGFHPRFLGVNDEDNETIRKEKCLDYVNKMHYRILSRKDTEMDDNMFKDYLERRYPIGRKLVENFKHYGATTWYEWCCENWGTKWNACESEVKGNTLRFFTAWGMPAGWLNELVHLGYDFVISSEIYGKITTIEIKDGKIISEETKRYNYDEGEE